MKTKQSDASPLIQLDSASAAKIAWLDSNGAETTAGTATKIRVKLGDFTAGKPGTAMFWELSLKLTDGTYVTPENGSGRIDIAESLVDQAS